MDDLLPLSCEYEHLALSKIIIIQCCAVKIVTIPVSQIPQKSSLKVSHVLFTEGQIKRHFMFQLNNTNTSVFFYNRFGGPIWPGINTSVR